MNELEERRVIRLLGEVGDAVEPLTADEIDALLQPAALGRVSVRRHTPRPRTLAAIAAAAAVVLGTTVLTRSSQPHAPGPAHARAELATFPDGSALQLLLAQRPA